VSNINGAVYTINSWLNYTVEFPNAFLDFLLYEEVSVNSIVWKVSPIQLSVHDNLGVASPFVCVFLTDAYQEVIQTDCTSYNFNLKENNDFENNCDASFIGFNSLTSCVNWEKEELIIENNNICSFALTHSLPEKPLPK